MAFVWTTRIQQPTKNMPLTIVSSNKGSVHWRLNTALSRGIAEACKDEVYYRFGVDMAGHRIALMFQAKKGREWRKARIDSEGRINSYFRVDFLHVIEKDIKGHYPDFHFDKADQMWVADMRKRIDLGKRGDLFAD